MFKPPAKTWAAALLCIAISAAHAFPDKSITMVVPFAPGSATDVNARSFGQILSTALKQPIIYDNRTGVEGTLGAKAVLSAPADGHTMLFTSSSLPVLDPLLRKNLPYDFSKEFAPLCTVSRTGFVMNISAASPLQTTSELIAAAKANPGKLTFAYSSATTRLAGELFQQLAGVKLSGVPYRSSVAGLTEVAGGVVDLMFIDPLSAAPFYQAGKVRPLVAAGPSRMKALPDVPSATEVGLPGYSVQPWYGLYVSSKVPADVLQKVRSSVAEALKSPEVSGIHDKLRMIPFVVCGDEMARVQADELTLWRQVILKAGIEPQ